MNSSHVDHLEANLNEHITFSSTLTRDFQENKHWYTNANLNLD